MNNKKIFAHLIPITVFLFTCNLFFACGSSYVEIDLTSTVNWVYDGDSFRLSSGEEIRLADIQTPEENAPGYYAAKNFTFNLIYGKTVYLDVDGLTRNDTYGRLICLAYISYNSTHYMNINKALLENNYAIIYDYTNNDFVPSLWTLYVAKNTDTQPSPTPIHTTNSPTVFPTVTPIPTTSLSPKPTISLLPTELPITPTQTPTPTQMPKPTLTPTLNSSPTIPEHPNWIILLILPIATLLALLNTKKKKV